MPPLDICGSGCAPAPQALATTNQAAIANTRRKPFSTAKILRDLSDTCQGGCKPRPASLHYTRLFARELGGARHNRPNEAVRLRLLGVHPVVAFGVARDLFQRLPGGFRKDCVQALAHGEDLARLDLDVGGGPAHATERLMQEK